MAERPALHENRWPRRGHLLVRAADTADVPDPAVDAAPRLGVLAGPRRELRSDHGLFLDHGDRPEKIRDRPDAIMTKMPETAEIGLAMDTILWFHTQPATFHHPLF